jgi:hypothetical protein
MAQIFERGQRVGFDEVPCQLALLGEDHEELPLPRQDSRISWTTEWSVRILEPRSFELTGSGLAAWHVAIYVEGELMFVLPIISRPVASGSLTVG